MSSRANFTIAGEAPQHYGLESSLTYIWDVPTLSWVKSTGGGGGVGGAVTVADGADVTQGTTTDVAWVSGAGTVVSLLKTIASSGAAAGLTDAQLRATPVPVSGTVTTGGLTDAQLRASPVPVSGPLTDTQLRATPVPVSGTVTASGPLTDVQLRASAVPVTANAGTNLNTSALNLEATQALVKAKTDNLDVALSTRLKPADTLTAVTTVGTITNVVHVDDNASSLTVDGTVTSNQGGAPWSENLTQVGGVAISQGQKVMASSLPVVVASDQSVLTFNGDIDHDVANTLKNIQIAGNATPVDVPPTLVSANGDRVRAWFDRAGAQTVRRRKLRETYTAVCRLAETTARLDPTFTFTANTNKQLVTLHHAATATKELRVQKVTIVPTLLGTAAGLTMFEIRYITGTPATGNPAITPQKHQQAAGATEAVVLVLPTTGGTDGAPNSPLASWIIDHGIEATTGPTTNPMPVAPEIVLYDASAEDDEMLPITLRVGTLEGIAITGRSTAAVVLRFFAIIKYTEEIP